jgi:sRNA-binding protein
MSSTYRIERDRGCKESRQQLAVLREKWPLAFPVKPQDVRPLAMGVARQVAAAVGWSLPYTLGVLGRWKMAPVYCQAVLCYDQRIALDGAPAEAVDAEACLSATNRDAAQRRSNCATGCVPLSCAGARSRLWQQGSVAYKCIIGLSKSPPAMAG